MKTILKVLAVLVLAAGTLISYNSVSAGGGLGGSPSRFRGPGANAFFYHVDESGCVFTQTSVFASEQLTRNQTGSQASYVSVFVSKYDSCTGTQLVSADGSVLLASQDLDVSRTLESATLNATVSLSEYVSGGSLDVDIHLTWTGVSPIGHEMSQFHYRFDGCQQKSQSNGTFRVAQVSGSVSDGGTEFTEAAYTEARIFSSRGGTIVHGCGS